jgi:2-keto-4-pentenoate hydratase/2-oxohepta-3-ene-1,7-dioic acid hydratase in catechol pathway
MKFLTFSHQGIEKIGVLLPEGILDLSAVKASDAGAGDVPDTMLELIDGGETALATVKRAADKKNPAHILALSAVTVLAPIPRPRKNIFCVGKNYVDHVAEMSGKLPEHPVIFSKPPTTVIGPEMEIDSHPAVTSELDYEGELAVVIGKRAKSVAKKDAFDYVFGYTILNDVTARDKQSLHGQWLLGKSFDTFCPMGPVLVHKDDMPNPHDLELCTRVNGEVRQATNTSLMIFDIATVIATITQGTTLEPGDIIATGTPSGVGKGMKPPKFMKAGDVVEVEIKGLGILRNPVA